MSPIRARIGKRVSRTGSLRRGTERKRTERKRTEKKRMNGRIQRPGRDPAESPAPRQ